MVTTEASRARRIPPAAPPFVVVGEGAHVEQPAQQCGERSAQQPKLIIQVKNSYGADDSDAARSELTKAGRPISLLPFNE
jgi:hypothetical protein